MKRKTAQITLFIIFGIILILIFISLINIYYDIRYNSINSKSGENLLNDVKSYMNTCIEDQTHYAIMRTYLTGGNYVVGTANLTSVDIPTLVVIDFYNQSYIRYEFKGDEVKQSIYDYLNETLPICFSKIAYSYYDGEVEFKDKMELNILMTDSNLIVDVNLPIVIDSGSQQFSVSKFHYFLSDVPFKIINDDVNSLTLALVNDLNQVSPQNDTEMQLLTFEDKLFEILKTENVNLYYIEEFYDTDNKYSAGGVYVLNYHNEYEDVKVPFRVFDKTLISTGKFQTIHGGFKR